MQDKKQTAREGEDETKLAPGLESRKGKVERSEGPARTEEEIEDADLTRIIQQLKLALEDEKRKSNDYLTRLKYLQADFENYRKRVDREIQEIEEFSTSRFARRLLPISDELDLAINSAETTDNSPLTEGLKMIRKNLNAALEAEGVKSIEALGKPFNPAMHEAVDKVQGRRNGEDIVIEEIRKGYMFKDKVLRPSMVKVELSVKEETRKNGKKAERS